MRTIRFEIGWRPCSNLGDSVDLANPVLSYDAMHLTAAGNERAAAAFVQPVREMAAAK